MTGCLCHGVKEMRIIRKVIIFVMALSIVMAVPVTSHAKVSLNKTKVTLTVGKTVTLKVKGTKAKVKWSSSKKSVASVSKKGKVKARKPGKAYITAKVGAKKYRCRVIVKAKKQEVDSTKIIETPNTIKDLTPYLKATTNCQVNNSKIKATVKSVTAGLTSSDAKAKAIYNYVNDKIATTVFSDEYDEYDEYNDGVLYNGQFYTHNITHIIDKRYGAVGTLTKESGSSADQAHLLIAMLRAAGIPARYIHGTVIFNGKTAEIFGGASGHVWVEFLTEGNKWHALDTVKEASKDAKDPIECSTNYLKNSYDSIVTWNYHSYSLHSMYASLPF